MTELLEQQKQKLMEKVERVTQEKKECVEEFKKAFNTLQEKHDK